MKIPQKHFTKVMILAIFALCSFSLRAMEQPEVPAPSLSQDAFLALLKTKNYQKIEEFLNKLTSIIPEDVSPAEYQAYQRGKITQMDFAQNALDTALVYGIITGDLEMVTLAVSRGARVNSNETLEVKLLSSPLEIAKNSSPEPSRSGIIAYLMEHGALSWDKRPKKTPRSLMCLALKASLITGTPIVPLPEDLESLRNFILSAGTVKDKEALAGALQKALSKALVEDRTDYIEQLLECGAPARGEVENNVSFLSKAITNNNPLAVEALLRHGAHIQNTQQGLKPDELVQTSLVTAIKQNSLPIVETLLKHGARVNDVSEGEIYPLDAAVSENNKDIVDLLIKHNADVKTGRALLYVTSREIAELLLKQGANPNYILQPRQGGIFEKTPLINVAQEKKDPEIGALLLKYGADPNFQALSYSALMLAAVHNKPLVPILLSHGADTTLQKNGLTALGLAKQNKLANVASLLEPATLRQQETAEKFTGAAYAGIYLRYGNFLKMEHILTHKLLREILRSFKQFEVTSLKQLNSSLHKELHCALLTSREKHPTHLLQISGLHP